MYQCPSWRRFLPSVELTGYPSPVKLLLRPFFFILLILLPEPLCAATYDFVLPESPWKYVVITALLCGIFLLAGLLLLIGRYLLGDRSVKLPVEIRAEAERVYAGHLRAEYRKKMDVLNQRLSQLRQRFSLVMLKVKHLSTTLEPKKLFKSILEMLEQEVGAERYIVFLLDEEKEELYPFRWKGYDDRIQNLLLIPLAHEHFLSYSCRKRQMIYRGAALDDPETKGLVDRKPVETTLLALPICTPEKSFGVIHVESFTDGRTEIDDADLRFFSSLSSFMGLAWGNANVFLQTRDELTSTKELSEKELVEKKRLQEIFSRYTSAELVSTLMKNPKSINLGGTTKVATILFSDIAGFTNFSSKLSPEQVVVSINEYLSRMTEVVLDHQGEIDKFIGDAVMARFGVLGTLPSPGLAAVRAGLAMLEELKRLQATWAIQGRAGFSIRIGIATGPVLAGNIGSKRRQEFTVMGTTVNLASRLENLNKELKTTMLIDETTFQQIQHEVRAVPRENISIRGLEGTMRVYEVIGFHEGTGRGKIISFQDKLAASRGEPAEPDIAAEDEAEPKVEDPIPSSGQPEI